MAVIFVRTMIIFLALLLTLRLLGKRQLGQLELSEFILAAVVADLAALPLQDLGIPLINGLLPIALLFCCELLISGAAMKSPRLRCALYGRPSLLIVKGKLRQKELVKDRLAPEELMQELRRQGVTDISQVQYAVLENSGQLSLILFPEHRSATAGQLGLKAEEEGYPSLVISRGRILDENLSLLGFDRSWLAKQLNGLSPDDVFLMVADSLGRVYLSKKEGK